MNNSFFGQELWGLPISNYFWCVGIVLGTLLLKRYIAVVLARVSNRMAGHYGAVQEHSLRGLIMRPLENLLQVVLFYIALYQVNPLLNRLSIKTTLGKAGNRLYLGGVIDHIALLLFIVFFGQLISRIVDYIYYVKMEHAREQENLSQLQLLPLMRDMAKLLLWTLCVFWILGSVFAVNIPALITGLGIGGVAIALAGKETVENLFAAFTILSDRPFQTDDVIRLGDFEGKVERVGFRSTHLRNADGLVYIIPNKKLVGENLINLTQRDTQGVSVLVNIKYGVLTHELVQQMVEAIKDMLKNTKHVLVPINVSIETFGENIFGVRVSYFLPNPMPEGTSDTDVKQQVNLGIYDIVNRFTTGKGVEITNTPPAN